jgi:hypothetical protein
MVFSSDEKRDKADAEFRKALTEWGWENGGLAVVLTG